MLFQLDVTGASPGEVFQDFWQDQPAAPAEREFTQQLVLGVRGGLAELDRRIGEAAEHWRIERMAVVDRNVLRMALHELLADPETPAAVVLSEAVEVAKKFGGAESGAFVNGVLDAIRKKLRS
jgi:N utilization substance protein B